MLSDVGKKRWGRAVGAQSRYLTWPLRAGKASWRRRLRGVRNQEQGKQRSETEKHGVFQEQRHVQEDSKRKGKDGTACGFGAEEVGKDQSPLDACANPESGPHPRGTREPWKALGRGMT